MLDRGAAHIREVAALGDTVTAVLGGSATVDDVLRQLRRVVPFEAAMISAFDPLGASRRTLARMGYSDKVVSFANSDYSGCPSFAASVGSDQPMRMRDFAFDFRSLPTFTEVLGPAGFQEGATTVLRRAGTAEHVGLLVISQRDREGIGDHERDIVRAVAPMLARLTDDRARRLVGPKPRASTAAALVTRDGVVRPLDRQAESLCSAVPAVVSAAVGLLGSDQLSCSGHVRLAGRWWWVRMTRADDVSLADPEVTLVLAEQRELPLGLTPREMEVLSLLMEGRSNAEIAAALVVSVRTVTTHIEHLFVKLGCPSRAGCAARAAAEGLRLLQ